MELLRGKQLPRRILLYVFGYFVIAVGVVLAVNADLGVMSQQVLPLALSRATGLSLGTWAFIMLASFTLIQIPLLGRKFQWFQLTQVGFSLLFGFFIDFVVFLMGDFQLPTYFGRQVMLWVGMVLVAAGITLYLQAQLIAMSPEGLINAILQKMPKAQFHWVKIIMDSALVALGVLVAFVFLGELVGFREGTVLSAFFIGRFMPYTDRVLIPLLKKMGFRLEEY